VTVLAGVLLFLLRICCIPRNWALLLAAGAAWLYALVTGWQTPVVRSAAGFTLFVIAGFFFRRGRILNLLAAVGLVSWCSIRTRCSMPVSSSHFSLSRPLRCLRFH
jgi:Competence protein.